MLKLPGYETLEKIHEGKHTLVYRADTEKDKQPVIFKTINSSYPTPAEISRLKKEYEITSRFHSSGVVRTLALVNTVNSPVIILEDFGGVALNNFLQEGPLELAEFLPLAVKLAEILCDIHAQNIIHKDINPANIVWNREQDILKIIDFGISLELSREVTGIKNPNVLEGTLAYISPEQTGRMNRFLDYRTDYYSLGVTLYRMLAGRLPFESADAMEMVYAHIARHAQPLHELDGKIPRVVSDIVHKLMAKNVEDRYQNANALLADLKRCQDDFLEKGTVVDFIPGETDVSGRFQIPQKLYGREDEIAALLTAFERASQGDRELMLVSGLPGIGKSALVNEIQKSIVKLRGNFIAGKYDKFKKDVPYSALIHAFSGLVKHLLAENEEQLADWKRKILEALGPNGRVITDVFPRLELVIGKQPPIPELGPEESRNRFNIYFQFFMGVFCKAEHPLVLFLDDLQWADHASLEMMKLFLSEPDIKHFFVIGAFRSNEVDAGHPLNIILGDINRTGTRVSSTAVTPLTIEAIQNLLCDSLHCTAEAAGPLAELLLRKTGGNPFFLGEFLKTLYQDELLVFEPGSGWNWDMGKIKALQVTDNVVELMAAKIEGLPGDCGDALKLGACFGNYFKEEALAEIAEKSMAKIQAALDILLEEGLLIKREDNYNFAHDRIQEAAYSLISEADRILVHHRIGHMEFKRTNTETLPQNLFYIVNQLNAARRLIDSESGRLELAELNFRAGAKARSAAAYRPALTYLELALGLLEADAWKNQYEFTLKVNQEAISAAFLCGAYERMDELADTVFRKNRDVLDTVLVYEAKIFAATAQNHHLQAVRIGLLVLGRLGVGLPANPGKLRIFFGHLFLKWTLWGKSIKDLENRPLLKDSRKLAMLRIMSSMGTSAYLAIPGLMPLIIFKMMHLFIKDGLTVSAPIAYVSYGMMQCGILGDMEKGYAFGQLALRLLEKLDVQEGRARTHFVTQYMITGWKEHMANTLQPLKNVLQISMEAGDPEFIGYAANTYILYSFFCGRELTELEKECAQFKGMIGKLNQLYALYTSNMERQLLLNLLGNSEEPHILKGDSYDIDAMLPLHLEAGDENNIFRAQFFNCFLNHMFGFHENALECAGLAESYLDSMRSSSYKPVLNLYKSLSQLALYKAAGKSRRRKFLSNVRKNQKKMKHWAVHAPMNFEHKYQLVEAEKARALGLKLKAIEHYEQAVLGARKNKYLNEEALALELFAKFWLEFDKEEIACLYMKKARQAYRTWGAQAKVKELEKNHPRLMQEISDDEAAPQAGGGTVGTTNSVTISSNHEATGGTSSGKLDLATVVKASQTIAGEIILSQSLEKMTKIVMENAGARKGFLILEVNGELFIEAAGFVEKNTVTVLQSEPVGGSEQVPEHLIHYVARARETVVLKNASREGEYTTDEYILKNKVASVLCAPILNQGKLSGVLYLENNAAIGAFTADRVEVLGMLSSQIAVSIDNARLYANLEENVKERTIQLERANTKLRKLDELKSDLFANISHEIRTPLTLILSPLDNLLKNDAITSDPAQLSVLNTMVANGQRLLKQVNDMLDLAKFDADKMQIQYQRTNIVEFIREIAENFKPLAESKNIDLQILGDSSLLAAVDPEKFEKGIVNLLGNAFKFTESGEIHLEISRGRRQTEGKAGGDQGWVTIKIRDTGVGIPEGQEEEIFQRFRRGNTGEAPVQVGTGIGLALVREIVNMHKGRVWAEPSQGRKGAELLIEIPPGPDSEDIPMYKQSGSRADKDSSYIAAFVSTDGAAEQIAQVDMSGPGTERILIVEDNHDMREYLASILRDHFSVIQAENGLVGLELARKHRPGLILSDVMMPVMDGLQMLAELREDEATKVTPIIMLSAKSELDERLEGLTLGADDYLAKPFRPAELLLKIRNLLHKNSLVELERHKERENIFADLHDYLGGSLTDMTVMVERMKETLEFESENAEGQVLQLEGIVQQTVLNYKQCFKKVEELNHLQGDFVDGLNLILLGRYSNSSREIKFEGNESIDKIFLDQRYNSLKQVIYAVSMEIVTNDLKYGKGLSRWKLDVSLDNELLLEFSASTDESKVRKKAGRGTGNIRNRVEDVGGVLRISTNEGLYDLSIRIPFVLPARKS